MKGFKILSIISLFAFTFNSCSSLDEPVDPTLTRVTLTTKAMSNVDRNTASCGGEITNDGSSQITARGVVWSTLSNPTTADFKTVDGSGLGSFNSSMTGLLANTSYFVRAYATNGNGTTYGDQVVFTTTATSNLPILTTTSVSNITTTGAISGGNITSQGGSPVIARGVVYSTNPLPTTADFKTIDGSGTGAFTSTLSGLTLGTVYYVRAYATNGTITAYGNQYTFTTLLTMPVIDYWPRAINNQWVMKLNSVDQSPMKIISIDVVNTLTYYTFTPTTSGGATTTTRIRKLNSDYYTKIEDIVMAPNGPIPGSTTTGHEELFLKDNLAVGATWNQTYTQTTTFTSIFSPIVTTVNTVYSIEEKGVSLTVNGVTFNNVIKTKAVAVSGIDTTTTYSWYANNIGPIKSVTTSGTSTTTQELSTYFLN